MQFYASFFIVKKYLNENLGGIQWVRLNGQTLHGLVTCKGTERNCQIILPIEAFAVSLL
jgi:hypothetical protein